MWTLCLCSQTPTRRRQSYGDREVFDICGGKTEVDILLTDLSSRSVTRLPSLFYIVNISLSHGLSSFFKWKVVVHFDEFHE